MYIDGEENGVCNNIVFIWTAVTSVEQYEHWRTRARPVKSVFRFWLSFVITIGLHYPSHARGVCGLVISNAPFSVYFTLHHTTQTVIP